MLHTYQQLGKMRSCRYCRVFKKKNRCAWKLRLLYTREHAISQEVSLRRHTKDAWVGRQRSSYEVCSERNGAETSCFLHMHSFKEDAEQH
jgi:hypothetical protein